MTTIDWATNLATALGSTGTATPNIDSATKSPCGTQDANVMEFWIEPKDSITTAADEVITFIAYARYSNGNMVNVTSKTTWVSMAPLTVMVPNTTSPWIMTAGLKEGETTSTTKVYASFKGFTVHTDVTVCEGIGTTQMDIVFVVDASQENAFLLDYAIELKEFVRSNASKLEDDQVRIGITASAGFWVDDDSNEGIVTAQIIQELTSDVDTLNASIDTISELNRNTCLEDGVDLAVAEFASTRHRIGAESVIIILDCDFPKIGAAGTVQSEGGLLNSFTKNATDIDIKVGLYWIKAGRQTPASGHIPLWPDSTFCYVYSLNATKCTAFLWDAEKKGNIMLPGTYHNLIPNIKGHFSYMITKLKNGAEYCQYNVN